MHFIDLFDRVEIINLVSRKDRKNQVLEQLGRIGCSVDGERIRLFEAVQPANKGEFPSIGARGCFESHLDILRRANVDGVDKLLIIEDDLNFSDEIEEISPDFYTLLTDKNWDFVYLAHHHDSIESTSKQELIPLANNVAIRCTHLIGVSGRILTDLVGYLDCMRLRNGGDPDGGPMHVDGAYSWYRNDSNCNTVIATPPLGYQRSSRSDIADVRFYDRLPIVRNIVNYLRIFK